MKIKADKFANVIRSAIVSYLTENGMYEPVPPIVLAVGDSVLLEKSNEELQEMIFIQLPAKYGQMFIPGKPRPGGSSSSKSFACPHCGKAIKYDK